MCRKRVVATFLSICIGGTLVLALAFQFLVSRYPAIDLLFEYAK